MRAILNIIKSGDLTNDDMRSIAYESIKKLPPETTFPSEEIHLDEEAYAKERRKYSAVYGVKRIAEERVHQLTKGHDLEWDSQQPEKLINAAIFCLTEDMDYLPEDWNKGFMEKILSMDDERKRAIAGAFVAAYLDLHEFARERNIEATKNLENALDKALDKASNPPINSGTVATIGATYMEYTTASMTDMDTVIDQMRQFSPGIQVNAPTTGSILRQGNPQPNLIITGGSNALNQARLSMSEDSIMNQVGYPRDFDDAPDEEPQDEEYEPEGGMDDEDNDTEEPPAPRRREMQEYTHIPGENYTYIPGEEVNAPPQIRNDGMIADPNEITMTNIRDDVPPLPEVRGVDDLIADGDRLIVEGDIELD